MYTSVMVSLDETGYHSLTQFGGKTELDQSYHYYCFCWLGLDTNPVTLLLKRVILGCIDQVAIALLGS